MNNSLPEKNRCVFCAEPSMDVFEYGARHPVADQRTIREAWQAHQFHNTVRPAPSPQPEKKSTGCSCDDPKCNNLAEALTAPEKKKIEPLKWSSWSEEDELPAIIEIKRKVNEIINYLLNQ